MLTLANFKQMIPSQILARGRDYFRSGNVVDLTMDEEGFWAAQVQGTELYDVTIEQIPSLELICSCTCPYDMSEHCKHIAAVLYAIEETFPEFAAGKKKRTSARHRSTKADALRQALQTSPQEKLVEIILEHAKKDRDFANHLRLRLDMTGDKPADYQQMVKDALRSGRGQHGFIDYRGTTTAANKIYPLFAQAQRMLNDGEVRRPLAIYKAVLEEVAPILYHADDSSGSLGGCIASAIEGLSENAARLPAAERRALLDYCMQQAQRKEFSDFDFEWDLFQIAADLVDSAQSREALFAGLDAVLAKTGRFGDDGLSSRHHQEHVASLKLSVIRRMDGADAAEAFILAHAHLDHFRQMLIERHIAEGKFDDARTLIQAGIDTYKQTPYRGIMHVYRSALLSLAVAEKDTDTVIKVARALWLETGKEEYFQQLKRAVQKPEWIGVVESLIEDLDRQPFLLGWLLAHEGRWAHLLKLAQRYEEVLGTYHQELEKRFPNEIAQTYEQIVTKKLQQTTGRDVYQAACALLTRMKMLGKGERVQELVQEFRSKYPQRRALLEELSRV